MRVHLETVPLVSPLLLSILVAACGSRETQGPGTQVFDSAGVEIVIGPDASGTQEPGKVVFPPVLALGSDTEGPELFGSVRSVFLSDDGRLWLTDGQAQELRVFEFPSGIHVLTLGGPGEGPGEYRAIRWLGFDSQGKAYVYDDQLRRLTVYTPDGEIEDQKRILLTEEFAPRPFYVDPDGHLMGQIPRPRIGGVTDGQLLQDTVRIWSIDPDGSEPSLMARVEGPLFYYREFLSSPVPFRFGGRFAFHGDQVYFTHPSGEASYLVFGSEGLRKRVGIDRPQSEVSDSDLETYFRYLEGLGWPAEMMRNYETHLDEMPVPDVKPTWDYPLVAEDGHVWLSRIPGEGSEEIAWDVFEGSGTMVGAVATPVNLIVHQVTGRYVVGVLKDEFDRQSVVVLEVKLPKG